MHPPPALGIFVGGASRRMDGRPKGLLEAPDGRALLLRLVALGDALALETWLVGDATPYAALGLPHRVLQDRVRGIGPLGGLAALLHAADERRVIALSCDLPFVTEADLRELIEHPSSAPILCARREPGAPLEPFFARYDARRLRSAIDARIAAQDGSLQRFLESVQTETYVPSHQQALDDWDCPEDVARAFDRSEGNG